MKACLRISILSLFFVAFAATAAPHQSCWGQATKVFASMGEMGEHASEQEEPRVGLANLAWALYDAGVLSEPTLWALGAFVADELGLSIEQCMNNQAAVTSAELLAASTAACWGQASAVFSRMGMMGQHSSQQSNPRLGLRNLARSLYELGVISEDSLASLGEYVSGELGLDVDACM